MIQRYDPARYKMLVEYLTSELRDAQNARKPLEDLWIRWDNAYRCKPDDSKKDFPFQGAANLVIPVIATDVDTIFARLMGIIFAPSNLWSIEAKRPDMVDIAPRIQEFLEWAQENEVKPYDAVADWILEIVKKGTGVLKQRYTRDIRKVYEWRETDQGVFEQMAMMLLHDHPSLHRVAIADFYTAPYAGNIQTSPWSAERIMLTYDQYLERVKAGLYQGFDQFSQWAATSRGSLVEQNQQALNQNRPSYGKQFEFFEFWTDFDITGDMDRQALVCTIHPQSMTVLRADFNPFFNQDKPYSAARYMRTEGRFEGIGLCEMLDQFQEEVSAVHNQRLDASTIQNSQMYTALKGTGIREDEPIYPGRIWLVTNHDDVKPLSMGGTWNSTVQEEHVTLNYAAKRTGVNDYVQGAAGPAQAYGAAYTTQQMLQAGAKRFDQTLREVRVALSESGTRVLELYQQYNQRGKEFIAMGPEDGSLVSQVLRFPLDLIRRGLRVTVTATDAVNNKEVQIRTNTILMQQLTEFYTQYMTGLSYVINPALPAPVREAAYQMIQGGSLLMRRILDTHGVQDASRLVPNLQGALDAGQAQLNSLAGSIGAGGAGPPAVSGVSGMGAVPGGPSGVASGQAGGYGEQRAVA